MAIPPLVTSTLTNISTQPPRNPNPPTPHTHNPSYPPALPTGPLPLPKTKK